MNFLLAGINYADAPLDVLERVAINGDALTKHVNKLTHRLNDGNSSAAIVSTCNRTELYAVADDAGSALAEMCSYLYLLADRSDSGSDISGYIRTKTGLDAVHHLFRVVTGLDSLVTGDHQVAGQVTKAFRALSTADTPVHPRLSRMFHEAFRTGRRARKESGLGWSQVSIPSFGVRLLEREIGRLQGKSALLIGAGDTGRLTATALTRVGVMDMKIASRSMARAEGLASEIGGSAVSISGLASAIADVDFVIACTASEHPVISALDVKSAIRVRGDRILHVLDLGVPRDVDPAVADIDDVRLYTIQDIEELESEHRVTIARSSSHAEEIVSESASRFMRNIEVEPVLKELGERAERARAEELERTLSRMSHLTESDRDALQAMTRAIVKRLLSDPIQHIRHSNR